MVSSDEEWVPPPSPKERPKNYAALKARAKKLKNHSKSRFECAYCGKRFTTKQSKKNHKKSVHGKMRIGIA